MQEISVNDDKYIAQVTEIFKTALQDQSLTDKLIVQKYILHGTPYVFKHDENKYFDLKHEIAGYFDEHFGCVCMVVAWQALNVALKNRFYLCSSAFICVFIQI